MYEDRNEGQSYPKHMLYLNAQPLEATCLVSIPAHAFVLVLLGQTGLNRALFAFLLVEFLPPCLRLRHLLRMLLESASHFSIEPDPFPHTTLKILILASPSTQAQQAL